MTWRNGRELDSLTVGGKKTSYQYDVNGLRTKKTNPDGSYTQYYIVDGLTVGERRFTTTGSVSLTLRYPYDESRSPVGFGLKYPTETGWTNYYFAKNLQGDVTALYRSDASGGSYTGTLVAKYAYDPYGQVLSVTNASGTAISPTAANVANYNPFRYRGYYYDTESGFYYLQSRYYDPEICRFINADEYTSTGQEFLGYNMFAYCNNNPISNQDSTGELAITAIILIGSAIIGFAFAGYTAYKETKAGYDTADIVFDSIANGLCAFCSVYTLGMSTYECYLNFCALNAITPVTEVGGAKAPTPSVSVYGNSRAPETQDAYSIYNKVTMWMAQQ